MSKFYRVLALILAIGTLGWIIFFISVVVDKDDPSALKIELLFVFYLSLVLWILIRIVLKSDSEAAKIDREIKLLQKKILRQELNSKYEKLKKESSI